MQKIELEPPLTKPLRCSVISNPPATFTWWVQHNQTSWEQLDDVSDVLYVNEGGIYKCVALNPLSSLSKAERTFQVNVKEDRIQGKWIGEMPCRVVCYPLF